MKADVVLHILTEPRPIRLRGIVVRESRPGWTTLEVPPLEAWQEPLERLTHAAERFARGDLSGRLLTGDSQEIASLADSIDQMASELDPQSGSATSGRRFFPAWSRVFWRSTHGNA